MKALISALLVLGLLAGSQNSALAGNWDKYLAIYNRFYLLDRQHIISITCSIDAPDLDKWMQLVHSQVAKLAPDHSVLDTLDSYSLKFDKSKGLTINDPTLIITSLSNTDKTGQNAIDQALTRTDKAEFTATVKGIDAVLQGLFTLLQAPKPGNIDIYYISNNKNNYTVSYGMSGAQAVATYGPDSTKIKVTNQYTTRNVYYSYDKTLNGKLVLNGSKVNTNDLFETKDITTEVNYRILSNLEFPAQIIAHAKITGIDTEQTSHILININSCKFK